MPGMHKALFAALALTATVASAQTTYKCGSVYQDRPCLGATAIPAAPPAAGEWWTGPSHEISLDSDPAGQACKREAAAYFKDPESVRIADVAAAYGSDGTHLHFALTINAKNSMGGYVGARQYVCATNLGGQVTGIAPM
jgi:hypothetical protein